MVIESGVGAVVPLVQPDVALAPGVTVIVQVSPGLDNELVVQSVIPVVPDAFQVPEGKPTVRPSIAPEEALVKVMILGTPVNATLVSVALTERTSVLTLVARLSVGVAELE